MADKERPAVKIGLAGIGSIGEFHATTLAGLTIGSPW